MPNLVLLSSPNQVFQTEMTSYKTKLNGTKVSIDNKIEEIRNNPL
jgi:hypothetical protein